MSALKFRLFFTGKEGVTDGVAGREWYDSHDTSQLEEGYSGTQRGVELMKDGVHLRDATGAESTCNVGISWEDEEAWAGAICLVEKESFLCPSGRQHFLEMP